MQDAVNEVNRITRQNRTSQETLPDKQCRRPWLAGSTWFFTVNLAVGYGSLLLVERRG